MKILPLLLSLLFLPSVMAALASTEEAALRYGALPDVSLMTLSPSGDKIAFRKLSSELDLVMVVSTRDGKLLNTLELGDVKPWRLRFIGEDQLSLVASQYQKIFGSNLGYELSTAFVFDLSRNKLQQLLTPGDGIFANQSGLGEILGTSLDSKYVYMSAYLEEDEFSMGASYNSDLVDPDYALLKVDVENPVRPKPAFHGSSMTRKFLYYARTGAAVEETFDRKAEEHSFWLHEEGSRKRLVRFKVSSPSHQMLGFSPDEPALLLVSETIKGYRYQWLDLSDGSLRDASRFGSEKEFDEVIRGADNIVQGVVYRGFKPSYSFLDEEIDSRVARIVDSFPKQSVWLKGWSSDWESLLFFVEGNGMPGDYLLIRSGEAPRLIAGARSGIDSQDVNPVVEYVYEARDGVSIPTLLTFPRSKSGNPKNLPTVILPHGGPQAMDTLGFDWLAQAIASRGYLVVQPQFRGSIGFGSLHRLIGKGQWGRSMQDDLSDAVEVLTEKGLVDEGRVAIVGASYGGYAALAGAAFTPDLYRCAVSINGVSDLPRIIDDARFLSAGARDGWRIDNWQNSMIGDKGDKKDLERVSPVRFADKVEIPVLLIHGKDDTVVPFDQAKAMNKALKREGKTVELVKLSKEDHHLTRTETRVETLKAMIRFLDENMASGDS
ncbi:alpha/beta hydrolase family protein [Pelagicoccus albus]|uniref:S9 family peptidase n=1 Tax=Pelagicoccus albus TaxID=415222 RepID=A0A7X1EA74_9BACT|nr:prolyl oligopeptidase family serine peptidase [Pelagicoccus albus]MBC2608091.1 S9 family peptidase [Pelagicoccus albus]